MSLFFFRYCLLVTMPLYGLLSAPPKKAPAPAPTRSVAKQTIKTVKVVPPKATTVKAAPPVKLAVAKATPADAAKSAAAIQAALVFPESKNGGAGTWENAMVEVVASGRGRIDYEKGFARAVGLGALPPPSLTRSRAQDALDARDAALADALRTLGMAVQQVRVDAKTRVSNYTLKSDDIRVKVSAVVKGADVVEETFLKESGIWRVIVQTPLTGAGSVAEAVGTASLTPAVIPASTPTPTPAPTPEPDPYAPGAPAPAGCEYTGLIIDCRGLGVIPCRAPKLRDGRGAEVYGTMQIDPDFVDEFGIVSYPRNMGDARRSGSRAGNRPLIIRARRAGADRTCPVLSESDARFILDANSRDHFLERTAVMFVVD
ncbi:MAG: hypothetical protein QM758_01390 [Armatimonas sp.]